MHDKNVPHMLAILFDEYDDEMGGKIRSLQNILRVEGTDKNAKRRLRRAVLKEMWPYGSTDQIIYETYDWIRPIEAQDRIVVHTTSEDVTTRYKDFL